MTSYYRKRAASVADAARALIGHDGSGALAILWEIAQHAPQARDRQAAAEALLNRSHGKPVDLVAQVTASARDVGLEDTVADQLIESMLRGITSGLQGSQTGVDPALPAGNLADTQGLSAPSMVTIDHPPAPDAPRQDPGPPGVGVGPGLSFGSRGAGDPNFIKPHLNDSSGTVRDPENFIKPHLNDSSGTVRDPENFIKPHRNDSSGTVLDSGKPPSETVSDPGISEAAIDFGVDAGRKPFSRHYRKYTPGQHLKDVPEGVSAFEEWQRRRDAEIRAKNDAEIARDLARRNRQTQARYAKRAGKEALDKSLEISRAEILARRGQGPEDPAQFKFVKPGEAPDPTTT